MNERRLSKEAEPLRQPFRSNFLIWLSLLFVFGGLTAGCAFGDLTIQVPNPTDTTGYSGGNDRVVIIPPFVDKRPRSRIGMKKNGYGMDTANVLANQDISGWLGARLGNELKAAGFRVNPSGENPTAAKIQGFTHQVFIEPVMQWTTVDIEADISVLIRVTRPDGLEAERRYYVKGLGQALAAFDDTYAPSLGKASHDLMKRIVPDIINLLNRYPESQVRP